jgi:hypothetical protein
MYDVHVEWQTRVCPVGVTSLTRQFRRYFDRFEGRIKEPPYAVYDDLAYTQGNPPEKSVSPQVERNIPSPEELMKGPNLEEYRERLKGFAMDLGKEDDVMLGVFSPDQQSLSTDLDLADLYTFPEQPLSVPSYSQPVDQVFAKLDPFEGMSDVQRFTSGPQTLLSPYDVGSIPTSGSQQSGVPIGTVEMPDFLLDQGDGELVFDNWDEMFGDMPEMPVLDGFIDQGFLEFLDTTVQ